MIKFIPCDTLEEAMEAAPWAASIVQVDGGFKAFQFESDYLVWRNQK